MTERGPRRTPNAPQPKPSDHPKTKQKESRAPPGIEPGTSCTQSKNHTTRPRCRFEHCSAELSLHEANAFAWPLGRVASGVGRRWRQASTDDASRTSSDQMRQARNRAVSRAACAVAPRRVAGCAAGAVCRSRRLSSSSSSGAHATSPCVSTCLPALHTLPHTHTTRTPLHTTHTTRTPHARQLDRCACG